MSGRRGVGRRSLIGVASMLILVAAEAGIAKAEELDGELLALCREAVENHAESVRADDFLEQHGGDEQAHQEAMYVRVNRWHEVCAQIAEIPARTPEGMRGKAAVLADVIALESPMVASLCSDLLGRHIG